MRIVLFFVLATLIACSDNSDNAVSPAERLPFEAYVNLPEPTGGTCSNPVDTQAPLISSGHGYDFSNTRRAESILQPDNIASLELAFTYANEGVTELRGAPVVTAQTIFFTAGDTLVAINRLTGCRYWEYQNPQAGTVFRSASVILAADTAGGPALLIGDYNGNVHAVRMADGSGIWQSFAGTNALLHFVTGGMQYHDGTVIVPISSKEVVLGAFLPGGCCVSHGMVVALNAADGSKRWEYHTTADATEVILPGERIGPNGAPVWSTPTIDTQRNAVYFGTGQNYTEPTTNTSDAIISLDLSSGELNWIFQARSGDAWNYACEYNVILRCPDPEGHDFDFGAAPIIVEGGATLVAADKGGLVYAINADDGSLNWATQVSIGSKLGGIHWGMTADDNLVYAAATDFEIDPTSGSLEDLKPGANPGIYAVDIASGAVQWEIHPTYLFEGLETPVLYSASLALTNGVLFAGSLHGDITAFSANDGTELWRYNVNQALVDVNGMTGDGGTIDGAGFAISGDGLVVNSGYSEVFGGVGRYQAGAGNTLFVFRLQQ